MLDRAAVAALEADAASSDASAAFIAKAGETVWSHERDGHDPDRLIHAASVTKLIVGLCVAVAVHEGAITSPEDPACRWLPEWADDERAAITLRHLMTHTSGLRAVWPPDESEASVTETALALDLVAAPGRAVVYNNHGAQAVAEIVRRATEFPVDEYAAVRLFAPLGITSWAWNRSRDGRPYGMSALQLRPEDLGRIGLLALGQGSWNGHRVYSADWAAERPAHADFGLLEMLVPAADVTLSLSAGLAADLSDALREIDGVTLPLDGARSLFGRLAQVRGAAGVRAAWAEVRATATDVTFSAPARQAFGHDGSGGQHLWIVPEANAVAVRMRDLDERSESPDCATAFRELALDALLG